MGKNASGWRRFVARANCSRSTRTLGALPDSALDATVLRPNSRSVGMSPTLFLQGGGFDAAAFSYRYAIEPLSRLRPILAASLCRIHPHQ